MQWKRRCFSTIYRYDMWKHVNDRTLLVLVACFFVLLTLHLSAFEPLLVSSLDEMSPGERAELLCVVDEKWSTERGTMMWVTDTNGESIRVFANDRLETPEEGSLTLLTATMSDDRGILFAESFRNPV